MTFRPDIGNLHIIDYYLLAALRNGSARDFDSRSSGFDSPSRYHHPDDFDFLTEQREGWAYDYN